jgi:hypothetical protein
MSRTTNFDPLNLPPLFCSHEIAGCDLEDVHSDPIIGKISMGSNQIEEQLFVEDHHDEQNDNAK